MFMTTCVHWTICCSIGLECENVSSSFLVWYWGRVFLCWGCINAQTQHESFKHQGAIPWGSFAEVSGDKVSILYLCAASHQLFSTKKMWKIVCQRVWQEKPTIIPSTQSSLAMAIYITLRPHVVANIAHLSPLSEHGKCAAQKFNHSSMTEASVKPERVRKTRWNTIAAR